MNNKEFYRELLEYNSKDYSDEMYSNLRSCNTKFRLELLDSYHIPGNDLDNFKAFANGDDLSDRGSQWSEKLKVETDSGKQIERVRLVPENKSKYLEYELYGGW